MKFTLKKYSVQLLLGNYEEGDRYVRFQGPDDPLEVQMLTGDEFQKKYRLSHDMIKVKIDHKKIRSTTEVRKMIMEILQKESQGHCILYELFDYPLERHLVSSYLMLG